MRHISQCQIDESRDAIRSGVALPEVAGRLGIPEHYLAMLLRSTNRPKQRQGEGSALNLSSDAPNQKVSLGQAFRSKKAQKN